MVSNDKDPFEKYKVVVNQEDQYSIWPEGRSNPSGWVDAGKAGTKAECLEYIKRVWTDMRPRSLRQQVEHRMNEMVRD